MKFRLPGASEDPAAWTVTKNTEYKIPFGFKEINIHKYNLDLNCKLTQNSEIIKLEYHSQKS